ncbi:MAG: UDP-4-amino-4,6-dideoxy-N-acetyl-beta-L-altrosamine N-acetyltransferase [Lachnospiraceae bacterium]|nr:UDP-4-amino-4,6-dideoxy-N-acetyl-beta-L-altrosamine N-acetyltransferase [Lachnospiraceae bacterium]
MEQILRDPETGIYLRPMTYEDTDLIVSWRNSDGVRKNFIYQALFTRESHENWIRTMVETGKVVQFIICLEDEPVGSVYIRDIDRIHRKAEYGIFIGEESARGRGVGTVAARLMLDYCFGKEGLHKVFLRVFADNVRACRSYEKAGFVREAYLKEDVCIDGVYRDMILMAVWNPEENEC